MNECQGLLHSGYITQAGHHKDPCFQPHNKQEDVLWKEKYDITIILLMVIVLWADSLNGLASLGGQLRMDNNLTSHPQIL